MKIKSFDCIHMKRAAQEKIRAAVAGMNREQEIAFFREGADEFGRRLDEANQSRARNDKTGRS